MTSPVNTSERVETIDVQSTTVVGEAETNRKRAEEETASKVRIEEFSINGESLVTHVRELIHQGNIRRIIIKNKEGGILIEIPLTVGLVGGALAATLFPILTAIGVIGAMVANLTLVVEKEK